MDLVRAIVIAQNLQAQQSGKQAPPSCAATDADIEASSKSRATKSDFSNL